MKKMMMILTGLMLSMIALAQPGVWIERLSESEIDNAYLKYHNGSITTTESYVQNFIKKFGIDSYHFVINTIERGRMVTVMDSIKAKGQQDDFCDAIADIRFVDVIKTCFISKGRLYVMTYEPVPVNNLGSITEKNIYLYRRDDDSMRIASTLIRKDYYLNDKFVKQLIINSNKSESIYKIADSIIVYVTKTSEWNINDMFTYYNTVILLVPDGNYGYSTAYFEPVNKTVFAVNQISSTSTNEGLTITYPSGTIIFKIEDNNVYVDSNSTIKLNRVR